MTIRECYDELGSDFDKVLSRLVSEALVKKFALKFLDDPSFGQLKTALTDKDAETAFRMAHTLKYFAKLLNRNMIWHQIKTE